MTRFYANENFPRPVVDALRRLGHDVLTIQETGKGGDAVPDEEVLAYATTDKRVVLTINRHHFVRLHCYSASATQESWRALRTRTSLAKLRESTTRCQRILTSLANCFA